MLLAEALLLGDLVVELYHLGGGGAVELHEGRLGEGSLLLLRQREVGWKTGQTLFTGSARGVSGQGRMEGGRIREQV